MAKPSVVFVKPSVGLTYTWGSEELVAAMADVLYRGLSLEEALAKVRGNPSLVRTRIINFLRHGHFNVFEFTGAAWLIEGSRALTHELVRHRLASYWQESQRFVDYKESVRYIAPPDVAKAIGDALEDAHEGYVKARGLFEQEDARYILPNATASRIWVQMNMREFLINFLPLRTGLGAFHEIRLIAWLMYASILDKFPIATRWVWEHLPRLHPDYASGYAKRMVDREHAKRLMDKYGTEDPRILSIVSVFEKWGMEIPEGLKALISEVKATA